MREVVYNSGRVVRRVGLVAGAVTWLASVSFVAAFDRPQAGESGSPAPGGATLSDDELTRQGEQAITKICTECHPFDDIVVLRRTPKGWRDITAQMATKGAIATQDQFAVIRQYLTRYYGQVPVNTAPAPDLSAVLGLTVQEAEAVVAYREAHGKFADLAALLKVPGVAKDKLEADPDALRFE